MRRSPKWIPRCWRLPPISAVRGLTTFWLVTFPLSLPGIGAGALLCFIPIVGEFVISGSAGGLEFADDRANPVAGILHQPRLAGGVGDRRRAAGAAVAPLLVYDRCSVASWKEGDDGKARARQTVACFNLTSLALGLAFLYLPIVVLVIYSFIASRLVTVWGGWSVRWYVEFFNDAAMLSAARDEPAGCRGLGHGRYHSRNARCGRPDARRAPSVDDAVLRECCTPRW